MGPCCSQHSQILFISVSVEIQISYFTQTSNCTGGIIHFFPALITATAPEAAELHWIKPSRGHFIGQEEVVIKGSKMTSRKFIRYKLPLLTIHTRLITLLYIRHILDNYLSSLNFNLFNCSKSDLLHQCKWSKNGAARHGGQGKISSGNNYIHMQTDILQLNSLAYSMLIT